MLTATDIAPRRLGGGRVLVVETGEDSAACLTALLRMNGFDARAARSGFEAMRELASLRPRAVILDLDLPDMNAHDVILRARKQLKPAACAVIVVTAHADAEHRSEAMQAGANTYLVKPADPIALVKLLQDLCPPD